MESALARCDLQLRATTATGQLPGSAAEMAATGPPDADDAVGSGGGGVSMAAQLEWKRAQQKKGATQEQLCTTHGILLEQMQEAQAREEAQTRGQTLPSELQRGLMLAAEEQAQADEQRQQVGETASHCESQGSGGGSKRML